MARATGRARPGEVIGAAAVEPAAEVEPSLLDRFLPVYDLRERHSTVVNATVERVFGAIGTADLGRNPVVKALLLARALPALLLRRRTPPATLTLDALCRSGFALLGAEPPREIVLGLTGRFWRPAGGLVRTDATSFLAPLPAGLARVAWSFSVETIADGVARLATETRVLCADEGSRRLFRIYWLFVRPGSGLIRKLMLRAVRQEAESGPTR